MATRTYFSRHISKKDMTPEAVASVLSDIAMFNRIVHTAAAAIPAESFSTRSIWPGTV